MFQLVCLAGQLVIDQYYLSSKEKIKTAYRLLLPTLNTTIGRVVKAYIKKACKTANKIESPPFQ